MDPDALSSSCLIKWDPRGSSTGPPPHATALCRPAMAVELEEFLQAYGVRYYTVEKMAELGFTVSTLLDMTDHEIDDMMATLSQIFRWDLLVGERYGIKAAVRAHRRRFLLLHSSAHLATFDALSQEGLSEEPAQLGKEAVGSGSRGAAKRKNQQTRRRRKVAVATVTSSGGVEEVEEEEDEEEENGGKGGCGRQREHPFIVTEPGEVARGKKNGLDYLFHLYEQCQDFLIQVQNLAKERGEKCPIKVTNQVFRHAKKVRASYINKPKMRHYVHCYALHCLDEEVSNALRRAFKERGENVGAWRQACYKPLVSIAARQCWDIDAIFNDHPRLAIWYVPTKLRQLCHSERSNSASPVAIRTIPPSF